MARITHRTEMHRGGKPLVAECNSPAALGGGGGATFEFDTYYDEGFNVVADPSDLMDDMGLQWLSGNDDKIFEFTRAGLIYISATFSFDSTPGGTGSNVYVSAPDYQVNDSIFVSNPNILSSTFKGRLIWGNVGDTFAVQANAGTAGDTPLTYTAISIMRMLG